MQSFIRFCTTVIIVILLVGAVGCAQKEESAQSSCDWINQGEMQVVDDLQARLDAYVPTDLTTDLSHLDETQQAVLNKLVEASKLMNDIFHIQATPCRDELAGLIDDLPAGQQAGCVGLPAQPDNAAEQPGKG